MPVSLLDRSLPSKVSLFFLSFSNFKKAAVSKLDTGIAEDLYAAHPIDELRKSRGDLDGKLLISNDPFDAVKTVKGKLLLPERSGLGALTQLTF